MTMAVASAAAPTLVEGQISNLSVDLAGNLRSGAGAGGGNVVVTSSALPTGASTAANQTATQGSKTPGTAATSSDLVGGLYDSTLPTATTGQQVAIQVNANGAVLVNDIGDAGNIQLAAGTGSGSVTSATNLFSLDTTGYNGISIQVTSAGTTCTITYEQSNDNANWNQAIGTLASGGTVAQLGATTNVATMFIPVQSRFFRARVSTYTSGTVTAFYALRRTFASPVGITPVAGNAGSGVNDSGNPVKIGGVYNSTLPTFTTGQRGDAQIGTRGSLGVTLFPQDSGTGAVISPNVIDAQGAQNGLFVHNQGQIYNGATFDLQRSATIGNGVAATGIIADAPYGQFKATQPTVTDGQYGVLQTDNNLNLKVVGNSQAATYSVANNGYTAYATPTDLLTITGSASKTVYVIRLSLFVESTASARQNFFFIKRSTANTGGTATNPVLVPYDSLSAAATSVVTLYTAAPTLGNALGTLHIRQQASALPAGTTLQSDVYLDTTLGTTIALTQPIVLRGVNESLCINYAGAALTSGFTAAYLVEVVEK